MSPSSLIFVVVLAIWATYWALYIARRREHMATARSVDRFSSQMRVLQRRSVKAAPAQAVPASSGATSVSLLTAGALEARRAAVVRAAKAAAQAEATPAQAPRVRRSVRTAPVFALWGRLTGLRVDGRRLRAIAFLATAALTLLTGLVAAFGHASWAVPVLFASATGALFAWVRRDRRVALARRARVEAARRAAAERRRVVAEAEALLVEHEAEAARAAARPGAAPIPVAQEHVAPRPAPFDLAAFEAPVEPEAPAPVADPLLADDAWAPVPVPRPTYTMKARAAHPLPEPLEAPVPVLVEDDVDEEFWHMGGRAVGH